MSKSNQQLLEEVINAHKQLNAEIRAGGHDPSLFAAAVAVNDKMLSDTAEEIKPVGARFGMKTPTAEQLKAMQSWGFKWKRKHPRATEEQFTKAVCKHFKLLIAPDESY